MNGTTPRSSAGQADITARVAGSTAGTVRQGGQSVFASSTAPKSDAKRKGSAASKAPAVSEGSATSEGWSSTATAGKSPSLTSAAAMDADSGGLSGGLIAGIALLGLGLVGITGGALVAAAGRRRRATADARKRD